MPTATDPDKAEPDYDLDLDIGKMQIQEDSGTPQGDGCAGAVCEPEKKISPEEEEKKDTKKLIVLVVVIVAVFGILAGTLFYNSGKTEPITIDGLHTLNVKGELEPEQGYMYNGYSFVKYADVWYTQIQHNNTLYDVTFNYDPKQVENIPLEGQLNPHFVSDPKKYITFDPTGTELKWVAISNFGLSRSLAWAFDYKMIASCTKNETNACAVAGVVTCDDKNKSVIYFKESDDPRVILADNCVIIQGRGEDMVKAKDRLLLRWYGITGSLR